VKTVTPSGFLVRWLFPSILLTHSRSKTKSQTRCNIRKDAGLTRANTTGMKYCCVFFARGCCPYGWECEYLHTLPDPDTAMPDSSKDCFARDKFADYRDDMGGVGSFNRQNRTLYVGRIKETGNGQETEEVVLRHFKEWGDIERSESSFDSFGDSCLTLFQFEYFNIAASHSSLMPRKYMASSQKRLWPVNLWTTTRSSTSDGRPKTQIQFRR
jgi:hypothetical protein